jgi:hypothetical protein
MESNGRTATAIAERSRIDVHVPPFEVDADGEAPGMPPGTMIVAFGRTEGSFIPAMRRAATSGDARTVGAVLLDRGFLSPTGQDSPRMPDPSRAAAYAVTCEMSYKGRVVVDGLRVDDGIDGSAVTLPFTGGEFDPNGFISSQHHSPSRASRPIDAETIVVFRQPTLSRFEQKVSEQLPNEEIGAFDPARGEGWFPAVAAIAVFAGGVVAGVYLAKYVARKLREGSRGEAHMPDVSQWISQIEDQNKLGELGARAEVSTLADMRAELMRTGVIR